MKNTVNFNGVQLPKTIQYAIRLLRSLVSDYKPTDPRWYALKLAIEALERTQRKKSNYLSQFYDGSSQYFDKGVLDDERYSDYLTQNQ